MSDKLFRLSLSCGTTWPIVAANLAEARAKAEKYFPFQHVRIEMSEDGAPWVLVDAGCATCSHAEVMPDLGGACDVSCGGTE